MYTSTENSKDDPTSDSNIKKAIDVVMQNLKTENLKTKGLKTESFKFYATYQKEILKEFKTYEDAIAYLTIHPHVKVYVR
jgi:hypothetical protein